MTLFSFYYTRFFEEFVKNMVLQCFFRLAQRLLLFKNKIINRLRIEKMKGGTIL